MPKFLFVILFASLTAANSIKELEDIIKMETIPEPDGWKPSQFKVRDYDASHDVTDELSSRRLQVNRAYNVIASKIYLLKTGVRRTQHQRRDARDYTFPFILKRSNLRSEDVKSVDDLFHRFQTIYLLMKQLKDLQDDRN